MTNNIGSFIKKKEKIDYKGMSYDERVKIFKSLLWDVGITKTWKYEDAVRVIQEDVRKETMPDPIEREKVFKEYLRESKDNEDQEKKETKRR